MVAVLVVETVVEAAETVEAAEGEAVEVEAVEVEAVEVEAVEVEAVEAAAVLLTVDPRVAGLPMMLVPFQPYARMMFLDDMHWMDCALQSRKCEKMTGRHARSM